MAFQTYNKRQWFSCRLTKCTRSTCPGIIITLNDWKTCFGEVFQIYRRSGPGPVKAGDEVGIYYPRGSRWMGCPLGTCDKRPCPGTPSVEHGFQDARRWKTCWGEVFNIYAAGKAVGSTITKSDTIMLYYRKTSQWVNFGNPTVAVGGCPGATCPPTISTHAKCYGYSTKIMSP